MSATALFDPRTLDESRLLADPFAEFDRWFDFALREKVRQPEAMALATSDAHGAPSLRYVLHKGFVRGGFAFYTHYSSRKGRELLENPRAALAFHWPEFELQIRLEGTVGQTTREESLAYFHTRPRESQLGAHASLQGERLDSPTTFHERFESARTRFEGRPVELPEGWGGFRLIPTVFEFWIGRPFRLHDRFVFLRSDASTPWKTLRLYP